MPLLARPVVPALEGRDPKRTGSPLIGWRHSRAASLASSRRSVPCVAAPPAAGRSPKSESAPTARGPVDLVSRRCSQMSGAATVGHALPADDGHPLRAGEARHAACIATPALIGNSKRSNVTSRVGASPEKRSNNDAGRRSRSTGGRNVAAATFQNGLAAKAPRHHSRQRPMVRRLTPKSSDSRRAAVAPCRIAATSTTTAPR